MTQSIYIDFFNADESNEWDNFILNSTCPHFMLTRKYINHHGSKFQDASLVCRDNNNIISILPAIRENQNWISHKGLSFGGPVFNNNVSGLLVLDILDKYMIFLKAQCYSNIIIKEPPSIYLCKYHELIAFWMIKNKFRQSRVELANVCDIESLALTSRRKRSLKKALASHAEVRELQYFSKSEWYVVDASLKSRHDVSPVHTVEEINFLKSEFYSNIIFLCSYSNDKPIGVFVLYLTVDIAHVQYSVATNEGMQINCTDLLYDYTINLAKQRGIKTISFGISSVDGNVNNGLFRFKEEFGKGSILHKTWEVNL